MARSERAEAVRALLRTQRAGVLCSASEKHGGWPFGSLASYALSAGGEPIFLFSRLSQHTRNVAAEPRASLFVAEPGEREDPQTAPRACLLGRVEPVPDEEVPDARARYLALHPQAEPYLQLDFTFWRLRPEQVHFVGGFAQATWIAAAEVIGP